MSSASGRNSWPCIRCGTAIGVSPGAGRLPPIAVAAAAGAAVLGTWAARQGADAPARLGGALAAAAALLAAFAALLRARRRAWRCPSCGYRAAARALPSGPLQMAVAIPTFNNAGSIAEVVRRCLAVAPQLPLLVIDDGSTDGTGDLAAAVLAQAAARPPERGAVSAQSAPNEPAEPAVRLVIRHERNRGKGAAIRTALERALALGCSHLLTLDGDGQHDPRDIPALQKACARAPGAIIVGSRDLSDANVEPISRFGRAFSNFWLRVQTGVRLADSQSGMRIYPTAPVLSLGLRAARFDYEVEVLTVAARAGVTLASVPVRVHYPPPSQRVSHFDKLWDNVRISWVNTRLLAAACLWPLGWPFALDHRPPPSDLVRPWRGHSLGGIGHAIFFAILRTLGAAPAYLLLGPVVLYYVLTQRRVLAAVEPTMVRLLGPARGAALLRRQFAHVYVFARSILERAVVQVLGPRAVTFASSGVEHLEAVARAGQGALLLTAHVGNYPLAGAILSARGGRGLPVSVVMLDNEAETVKRAYEAAGAVDRMPAIIAINRGEFPTLRILQALRQGQLVAIQGDRITDEHWALADFLGTPAPFPTGVYTIAAAARVPVVAAFGFAEGRASYAFFAEPPREVRLPRDAPGRRAALADAAQWYARILERYVRRYPLQWFNFYDFWERPRGGPSGDPRAEPTRRQAEAD